MLTSPRESAHVAEAAALPGNGLGAPADGDSERPQVLERAVGEGHVGRAVHDDVARCELASVALPTVDGWGLHAERTAVQGGALLVDEARALSRLQVANSKVIWSKWRLAAPAEVVTSVSSAATTADTLPPRMFSPGRGS